MTNETVINEYAALAAFQDQLRRAVEATEKRTRQAGLQPLTFRLLLALRRQPAGVPATTGHLADVMQLDRNTITELIDDLVRRGFVTRERDKADRRRFLMSITPAGIQWLTPLAQDSFRELVVSGPDLLRAVRVAVAHAATSSVQTPQPRPDVADFAWRAVGPAPI